MTTLSVLIPTHGRASLLGRTLDSMGECPIPDGYIETIVVENGSKSGTEAIVQAAAMNHPDLRLRYMHVELANKSHALNAALKTVESGLVLFFDDDIRVDRGILLAYSNAAGAVGAGFFFGGPTKSEFERPPASWRFDTLPVSARGWTPDRDEDPFFLGFNWAAWKKDLEAVGGFDSDRGPGSPTGSTGQESDMQRRLRAKGIAPHYVPQALVWHYVPRNRSSVVWALRRSYRVGVEKGLNGDVQAPGFIGIQGAFHARSIARGAMAVVFHLLRARPSQAWVAVDRLFRSWGVARGHELRKSRHK